MKRGEKERGKKRRALIDKATVVVVSIPVVCVIIEKRTDSCDIDSKKGKENNSAFRFFHHN